MNDCFLLFKILFIYSKSIGSIFKKNKALPLQMPASLIRPFIKKYPYGLKITLDYFSNVIITTYGEKEPQKSLSLSTLAFNY